MEEERVSLELLETDQKKVEQDTDDVLLVMYSITGKIRVIIIQNTDSVVYSTILYYTVLECTVLYCNVLFRQRVSVGCQ